MAKKKYDEYIEDEEMYEESDEQYEEEEQEEYVDEKSARRVARRKRRIRNQIIAYAVLVVLIGVVVGGGIFGVSKLFGNKNASSGNDTASAENADGSSYDGGLIQIDAPEIALHYSEDQAAQNTPMEDLTVNPVDEYALAQIAQMSIQEKVAGLFFATPESMMDGVDQAVVAGAKTQQALETYAVGGIIYTTKNIQSLDKITEMISKTKTMSKYPLFIGAQEEGGNMSMISAALSDAPKLSSASEIGATGESSNAYDSYAKTAQYMASIGFNVDFAPNGMIGNSKRAFAADAETVSTFLYQATTGLEDNKVSAAVIGFPGEGSAEGNVADGRATVNLDLDTLESSDVVPYKMAVNSKADMIMVSNVSYPSIVGDYTPATMSTAIVTDLLRNQLGYDGVVITQPMNVKAVTDYYTSAQASVNAILAGCDMILMPENFKEAYQGVLDAVNAGEISESRLDESLLRIYRIKMQDSVSQN